MSQRYRVTSLADFPAGSAKAFSVGGRTIALFNVGGRLFAIDDACPHEGASLAEGSVEGTTVVCPWHAAGFDLACGKVLCEPAEEDVKSYPVSIADGFVEVEF